MHWHRETRAASKTNSACFLQQNVVHEQGISEERYEARKWPNACLLVSLRIHQATEGCGPLPIVPAGWDTRCRRDQLSLNENRPQANCCRRDPRSERKPPSRQRVWAKARYPYRHRPPPGLPLLSASYKGLFSCTCALSSV